MKHLLKSHSQKETERLQRLNSDYRNKEKSSYNLRNHFFHLGNLSQMKSKLKMTAMLMVLAANFAFANNPDVVSNENNYKEIRTQIENKMSVPDFIKEKNETQKVFVSFSLEKDGTIKILGTKGENKELNIFVEQKLNGEKITTVAVDSTQTFNIELKFRLL